MKTITITIYDTLTRTTASASATTEEECYGDVMQDAQMALRGALVAAGYSPNNVVEYDEETK